MLPLLFIHGACSTGEIWVRQRRCFPQGQFPTLPDLSEPDDQLIPRWADWLERTYPGPHHVVAHSLGGAVALMLARRYPSSVRGLVLVGTGPNLAVNPELLAKLHKAPAEALGLIAEWSLSPSAPASLRDASRRQIRRIAAQRAQKEFRAANQFSAESWLKGLQIPVAVIAGADDTMTPPALTRRFLMVWPQAAYFEIQEAGHLVMLEQPERFNNLLADVVHHFDE